MTDDDPLGPSRGCMTGLVLGAAIWAALILLAWAIGKALGLWSLDALTP